MKIGDLITEQSIKIGLGSKKKKDVLEELLDILIDSGKVPAQHKETLIKVLLERESLGSTGIGQGVGIPHGKCNCVDHLVAALGISQEGVEFDSLDGEPVHIFFILVAPEDSTGPHLKALARISRFLKDKLMRQALRNAKDKKQILHLIREEDIKAN
ncbi:MAG: PTS sugar transporter subunit IIA [Candidatus Omnitrophica bacterium]|nr:PTS sugar transporter subunit IIA [Candidatus Omnitrophota bacterium]